MADCKSELLEIISQFQIDGELVSIEQWGQGNINDTYLVQLRDDGKIYKYILQRVNHNVFRNVPGLMDNVVGITEHIRNQILAHNGDPSRAVLNFIKTRDNNNYLFHEGNYYRVYIFIDNVISYNVASSAESFYESAVAFGRFQKYLADFPADELYEAIPDFHNTRARYNKFIEALEQDVAGRAQDVKSECLFFIDRERYVDKFVDMLNEGVIPVKVTHNDTKINNVLLDEVTGQGICVIDLDTVMPGSVLFDFGDSIRSGCASLSKDNFCFRLDYFEQYAKGFLEQVGSSLTQQEIDNLAFSSLLMTLECGIRFLTDYLNGDVYFKVKDIEHNLRRTRTHIKLVEEMEKNLPRMQEIIAKLILC